MYKHGTYADMLPTRDYVPPSGVGTLPVYFGRLPVHQFEDYTDKVNTPILVSSFNDAVTKCGYNDANWAEFDLCEAIYAHFKSDIGPIGPIVLVNVLDPATMFTAGGTADVILTNGVGAIANDKVILNTVAIVGKVRGVDFSAEYSANGDKVIITDLKGTLVSPVAVTFSTVDPADVTAATVIGGYSSVTGLRTGISVVELIYQTFNMVPTIFDAPAWSHLPEVDAALKTASQQINGHWYAWVNSNLDTTAADTIGEAISQKQANSYDGANESPCWPLAKNGDKIFHLSTLTTVTMQRTDYANDNVPYETPSNKPVDITAACLADGTEVQFDQVQANELNAKGIRTVTFWGGRWVLWGPNTGAYEFGKDVDTKDVFDSGVRMMHYLMNEFQKRYGTEVDKPMYRAQVDTILNDFQEELDNLITRGALLYGEVTFDEVSNPVSDLVEGNFIFDVATTTTPPGKSLTARVSYTTQGVTALFGGEQA